MCDWFKPNIQIFFLLVFYFLDILLSRPPIFVSEIEIIGRWTRHKPDLALSSIGSHFVYPTFIPVSPNLIILFKCCCVYVLDFLWDSCEMAKMSNSIWADVGREGGAVQDVSFDCLELLEAFYSDINCHGCGFPVTRNLFR